MYFQNVQHPHRLLRFFKTCFWSIEAQKTETFITAGKVQRSQGTEQPSRAALPFKRGSVSHVYKKNGRQKLGTLRHELKQDLMRLKNNRNQMCVRTYEKLSIKSAAFSFSAVFYSAKVSVEGNRGGKEAFRVTTGRTNLSAKWVLAATSLPPSPPPPPPPLRIKRLGGGSDWFPVETHQR